MRVPRRPSKGLSTVDQICTMRQILGKCWEQNIKVHHLFIDFQAANYTIRIMEI